MIIYIVWSYDKMSNVKLINSIFIDKSKAEHRRNNINIISKYERDAFIEEYYVDKS